MLRLSIVLIQDVNFALLSYIYNRVPNSVLSLVTINKMYPVNEEYLTLKQHW